MAVTVYNAKLTTRNARSKLAPRREPYWIVLSPGHSLGYRKGSRRGGTWIARWLNPKRAPKFLYCSVGVADDVLDADGIKILSFAQAQETSRNWFAQQARIASGFSPEPEGPYSVRDAIQDYLLWYEHHRKDLKRTQATAKTFILGPLGDREVAHLTTKEIQDWFVAIASAPPRVRARKDAEKPQYRKMPDDPDAKRRRRATANRVLTLLKAALNLAWRSGQVASDSAWRKVKPFHNVDSPVVRYLTMAESQRLESSCDPNFRPMIQAALLTGCRYGELIALRVRDFDPEARTLAVRSSKSGKPRQIILTEEGVAFFAALATGRLPLALMLSRPDGTAWGKSHQQRPVREACARAGIDPPASFHVLRHTYASHMVMNGAPLAVVARQLGHADTRMTEKHYAHFAQSYIKDQVHAAAPRFGITVGGKVVALARSGRATI